MVYLFVLHRLAGKCAKIYNPCRTIVRLVKPLVLRRFRWRCGLCKISLYKKKLTMSTYQCFVCFYTCDLNLEVIETFQGNNYRLPHWKDCTICPVKFPEIRPGNFGGMVSAHGLGRAYRKVVFLARSLDNKSAR